MGRQISHLYYPWHSAQVFDQYSTTVGEYSVPSLLAIARHASVPQLRVRLIKIQGTLKALRQRDVNFQRRLLANEETRARLATSDFTPLHLLHLIHIIMGYTVESYVHFQQTYQILFLLIITFSFK